MGPFGDGESISLGALDNGEEEPAFSLEVILKERKTKWIFGGEFEFLHAMVERSLL